MSDLETARANVRSLCVATKTDFGAHTVTFQPLHTRKSEDRLVTECWEFQGQKWLFLAVCDGIGGCYTSQKVVTDMPGRIRDALIGVLEKTVQKPLDRENVTEAEPSISTMLAEVVLAFDDELGQALRDICPRPRDLSREQRESLIDKHRDTLLSAFNVTTLSAALVNVTHGFMWAIGVGDSTVALSTAEDDGTRRSTRLVKAHSFKDPHEYFWKCMNHPEDLNVVENERLLDSLAMSRGIGGYAYKFPATYSKYLFKYLPWSGFTDFGKLAERIKKPPYLSSEPSVKFVDLLPYRTKHPVLMIFTDGVDNVVDGTWVFHQDSPTGADPCEVVSKLLQDNIDPSLEELFGHQIEPRWSRSEGNKAVDILGNLIGGAKAERLEAVLDQKRLVDKSSSGLYIDDISIVVYEV